MRKLWSNTIFSSRKASRSERVADDFEGYASLLDQKVAIAYQIKAYINQERKVCYALCQH